LCLCVFVAIFFAGCRQDMQNQPKYKPLRQSGFFDDGRASRPFIPGTVARNRLRADEVFYTGKTGETGAGTPGSPVAAPAGAASGTSSSQAYRGYATEYPFPITKEVLDRGQGRFNIYCSVCHDRTGSGRGMIVQRGYRQPPSYHIERLRQAPPGYFFDVMTNGFGAMPDYAVQISPRDRWAIAAYIRVLQLSQQGTVADVPHSERQKLDSESSGESGK
jgi:mono/diheme cytochrome c family protein